MFLFVFVIAVELGGGGEGYRLSEGGLVGQEIG